MHSFKAKIILKIIPKILLLQFNRHQQQKTKMQNIKIGSGLHNLGNTCFFNAVMQVILYTPSLLKQYNQKNHSSYCKKDDWCIFCAIQRLWHQSKKSRVVTPNAIVSNLRHIFKKFRLGRQQDSHQFLRYLIQGMQDAETGKLGKDRQKNQHIITKTTTYHTFGGKMRTFVLCLNCHHKSLTTQRYYDLSIQCQRSNSLQQGLQNYFKVDDLTGANKYRCDSCKQLVNAKKGVKILSVPSVITFQFKRFTNSLRKIGKFIQYPRTLNLNRYMDHQQQPNKSQLELYGVIVHSGSSSSSGHYFAFVKNGNQWFQMNDSNVSRCTEDRVLRQQAYLLFYGKAKHEKMQQQKTPTTNHSENEILTNIKINGINGTNGTNANGHIMNGIQNHINKTQKIQINGKISKSVQKPKQSKKSELKPVRKQSQEQYQELKRKFSQDIQQLKEQIKTSKDNNKNNKDIKNGKDSKVVMNGKKPAQTQADKNRSESNQKKIEINGKIIDAPLFGLFFGSKGNKNTEQKQKNQKLKQQKQMQMQQQKNGDKMQEQDQQIDMQQPPQFLQRRRSKQQALSGMTMAELILNYADKMANLSRKIPIKPHRALSSVYNLRRFELTSKRRKLG